jgi:hypothetical protein
MFWPLNRLERAITFLSPSMKSINLPLLRERERERTLRIRAQVRVAFWEETDIKSSAVHETYWYSLACFHFNKCDKLHTQVCGIWDCNPPKAGYFGAKHFNFQNPHPQTGL